MTRSVKKKAEKLETLATYNTSSDNLSFFFFFCRKSKQLYNVSVSFFTEQSSCFCAKPRAILENQGQYCVTLGGCTYQTFFKGDKNGVGGEKVVIKKTSQETK